MEDGMTTLNALAGETGIFEDFLLEDETLVKMIKDGVEYRKLLDYCLSNW